MNLAKFAQVSHIQTQEEADALLRECIADLKVMVGPIVPFQDEEANLITRKNLVATAMKYGPEILARAEVLFKCKNPLVD